MKKVDTVVSGAVVTEAGVVPDACVAIANGRVAGLFSAEAAPESDERIECTGCLIMPGVVDAHVHSLGAPTEGFANSTAAAAAGGVTTIVDMPMDYNALVVTPQYLAEKLRVAESQSRVDFALWGAVKPDSIDQIEALSQAGVVGFKMFMSQSLTLPRMDDGSLLTALEEIARLGTVAAAHVESFEITSFFTKKYMAEGRNGPEMHLKTRPEIAEIEAVMRATEYARLQGASFYFCHISLARSVEHIFRQRLDYPRLTIESCPQYLLLSEETVRRLGGYAKINPPLRKVGENDAMWKLIQRGMVDVIASDHSPYPRTDKEAPSIFDCKPGASGVETLLPLMYSEGVVKRQLPLERLAALLCTGPTRSLGLYPRKGTLLPGSDADLVAMDPQAEWEISAAKLHQAAGWTPYEGMKVRGKPVLTMVRGQTVYRDGEVLGAPGLGRFVASSHNMRQDSPLRAREAA